MSLRTLLFGEPEPPERLALPIYDEADAIRFVRGLGYAVIKTKPPPAPIVGREFNPTLGKAKPRWVRSVGLDQMSYALAQDGWPVTVSRSTWERWVRKAKARS